MFIHFQMGWWLYYFFKEQNKYYQLLQNYDTLILKILNKENLNLEEIHYVFYDPTEKKYKINETIYDIREKEKKKKLFMLFSEIFFSLLLFILISFLILKFYHKKNQLLMDKIIFLNSFTHELKTPITLIKLNLQTLRRKVQKKYLSLIETSISELNLLNDKMNQILFDKDIILPKIKKYIPIDLDVLINKILMELEYNIKKKQCKVLIKKENIENPVKLKIPYWWLFLILKELITNAIKYSDNEIKITISKKNLRFKKYLKISLVNQKKNQNFQDFEIMGTGLGLYFVKEMLNKCDGKIELKDLEANLEIYVLIQYI